MAVGNRAGKAQDKPITQRAGKFLREVRAELRKTTWPNRKELVTYTGVVIATVIVIAIFVGIADFAFSRALVLIARLGG